MRHMTAAMAAAIAAIITLVESALSQRNVQVRLSIAGMSNMPKEVFEAATIDGANWRQQVVHIGIPMLLPTIGYWSVICTAGMLLGILLPLGFWLISLLYTNAGEVRIIVHYGIGFWLTLANPVLFFLARRSVKKDEELGRSADRLR